MKRFREFIAESKSRPPILIKAIPVHGSHAKAKMKLDEMYKKPSDSWFNYNENGHLGETQDDVHKALHKSEKAFVGHVGGADNHSHLYDYTDYSHEINSALAQKENGHISKDPRVKALDHATNHHLTHDLHVYHGLDSWDPGKESSKNERGLIHMPTFLSTSTSKHEAHKFSKMRGEHQLDSDHAQTFNRGHIIHIHLKKGANKGVYIGDHSAQTNISGHNEHEFLMPRDTVLKIHPQHTELNDGTKVWHATVHQHLEPRKI